MENKGPDIAETVMADSEFNRRLSETGFVHIPFLQPDEVKALRELFFNFYASESYPGLYVSAFHSPRETMREVSRLNSEIFDRAMHLHFRHVQRLGGSFIVKAPDDQNLLHPHQDWSIVDEAHYHSYTVWVPLQDITEENGAMYVLPGSHNWVRGYRHITIPSLYGKVYDLAWKHSVPVYMKAGEALVFDQALAHASKPNTGKELRIAATQGLITQGAQMRIYLNNHGTVEEYACDSEFYLEPEAQTGPFPFPKLRDTDFKPFQLNEQDFFTFAGINEPQVKKSHWLGRFGNLWNKK